MLHCVSLIWTPWPPFSCRCNFGKPTKAKGTFLGPTVEGERAISAFTLWAISRLAVQTRVADEKKPVCLSWPFVCFFVCLLFSISLWSRNRWDVLQISLLQETLLAPICQTNVCQNSWCALIYIQWLEFIQVVMRSSPGKIWRQVTFWNLPGTCSAATRDGRAEILDRVVDYSLTLQIPWYIASYL